MVGQMAIAIALPGLTFADPMFFSFDRSFSLPIFYVLQNK